MLKFVNFKNVNFDETFSYNGNTYKKIVRYTNKPGAIRICDGMVFDYCKNWECLVDREEELTIKPPKEHKKCIFRNTETEDIYGLSLTDEQIAFFKWLDEHGFLIDINYEYAENLDFIEIH